jgi:hypothetical protein
VPAAGSRSFPVSPGISATMTLIAATTRGRSTDAAIARPAVDAGDSGHGDGKRVSAVLSGRECRTTDASAVVSRSQRVGAEPLEHERCLMASGAFGPRGEGCRSARGARR